MPLGSFGSPVSRNATTEELAELVSKLIKEVTYLLNGGLDSLNVVALDAGTVIIYDLEGGPGTISLTGNGMVINNGSFDTFKVDVNGNVTMTSAVIQSQVGYPKITLNQNSNLLQAFSDALNHVDISPSAGTAPGIVWTAAGNTAAYLQASLAGILLAAFGSSITLQSGSNLNLSVPGALSINNKNGLNVTLLTVKDIDINGDPVYGTNTYTNGILTAIT